MDLIAWQTLREFDAIIGTSTVPTWLEADAANFRAQAGSALIGG